MSIPPPIREAVNNAWDAERPQVGDPEFWTKTAAADDHIADTYRELRRWYSQDPALHRALIDAEQYRRGQADDARRKLADALEGTR